MRVRFDKKGPARFISHLDLNRCVQRALRRAGTPVWYTQGFNPHPYVVFALPLPIYCESECECMDIRLEDEATDGFPQILAALVPQFPEGIVLKEAYSPAMKLGDVAFARYRFAFAYESAGKDAIEESFGALRAAEKLMVTKETKHARREVDLLPLLKSAAAAAEDRLLTFELTLPAVGPESVSPALVAAAMQQAGTQPALCRARRLAILTGAKEIFH